MKPLKNFFLGILTLWENRFILYLDDNGNQYRIRIKSMFICVCKGIKEADVRELGRAGMTCPQKLACTLEIDDEDNCCGRCINNISDFVTIASEEHAQCRSSIEA